MYPAEIQAQLSVPRLADCMGLTYLGSRETFEDGYNYRDLIDENNVKGLALPAVQQCQSPAAKLLLRARGASVLAGSLSCSYEGQLLL